MEAHRELMLKNNAAGYATVTPVTDNYMAAFIKFFR